MSINRRDLLKGVAMGTAAAAAPVLAENACMAPPAKWDEEHRVVIIGSGGAGLSVAVAGAQNGLRDILILEKMPFMGGNTMISGGAFNTCDPVRQGRQKIEDSPALHAEQTLKGGDFRGNPELVRHMTENSYDALCWLESLGVEFQKDVYQVYGGLYPRAHSAVGSLGSDYIKALLPQCEKFGIPIRTSCRVTRVIRETSCSGRVLGVEYETPDKKRVAVRATQAVVVASGGFGANPEMRAKYDPRLLRLTTTNLPCSTGDLIAPMEDIGADVVGMDHIQCNPGCPPGRKQRVVFHLRPYNIIMVDRKAERFVAEDERRDVVRDAILALPDQTAFCVLDDKGWKDLNSGHAESARKGLETGDAWTAGTVEELAVKMKVDPKALKATLDEFNAGVDAQKDKLGKKARNLRRIDQGPFWACYSGISVHHTMGGLRINVQNEVIDRYGKVISNVYAVGEVTGGIHGSNRLGGNAIADIFTNGRLTGIRLAKAS